NEYAKQEYLHVDIIPYANEDDKELILKEKPNKKIERKLSLRETYYSPKDTYMLVPLSILDEKYIARVETTHEDVKVSETDVKVINIMLMVYILAVVANID